MDPQTSTLDPVPSTNSHQNGNNHEASLAANPGELKSSTDSPNNNSASTGANTKDSDSSTSKEPEDKIEKSSSSTSSKPTKKRKKKVEMACVYCRRSHMICDDSRPCQRCIKRGISHLCHDEPSNPRQRKKVTLMNAKRPDGNPEPSQSPVTQPSPVPPAASLQRPLVNSVLSRSMPYNQEPFFYSEHAGSEFSSLNDFLSMIDDPDLVNGTLNDEGSTNGSTNNNNNNAANNDVLNFGSINELGTETNNNSNSLTNILSFSPNSNVLYTPTFQNEPTLPDQQPPAPFNQRQFQSPQQNFQPQFQQQQQQPQQQQQQQQQQQPQQQPSQQQFQLEQQPQQLQNKPKEAANQASHQPVISDSARDKFFLTAADPTTEISPEERLKQVIKAKLEAGLLQPYNYAKGYARLQVYMDNYMNLSSRQRILKPLSIFRPAFRAIARTLKDVDLVLVEESFERMLLDYDRVFTSMAIPACLWRRTGEIYRGNKEFASLVGVTTDDLKDGKLAIYELMSEESAVNFWEKYGAIAFDKGQKAVLTSCNLRTKDGLKRKSCCFSFTIRRDRYNIPSCIVGNFIPIDP